MAVTAKDERARVQEAMKDVAAALGKADRYSPMGIGDIVRVIDQESDQAGWVGSITGIHLGQHGVPVECRMNDDPELTYIFTPEQLMIIERPLAAQKAIDPGHGKTVVNENGGKQSKMDYAVGSADVFATLAMAKVQAEGDAKYGRDNWRLIPEDVHIEHALTHLALHRAGDTEEAHLAHALTRVHMAMALHIRPDFRGEME